MRADQVLFPIALAAWIFFSFSDGQSQLEAMEQARMRRIASYQPYATVEHLDSSAKVIANDPRPMYQATDGLQDEYGWRGWRLDYEDPQYEVGPDTVDDTALEWRLKHLDAKGVTVVAGGLFESLYPEHSLSSWSPAEINAVLTKVVQDYNRTGNPGKFIVREEEPNRFAIIGTAVRDERGRTKRVSILLDTPISLQKTSASAAQIFNLICEQLSAKAGVKVWYGGYGGMADNGAFQSQVEVGGENVPARTLLLQTADQMQIVRVWRMLCDADTQGCALSFRSEIKPLRPRLNALPGTGR
jgi:hypothetical protein